MVLEMGRNEEERRCITCGHKLLALKGYQEKGDKAVNRSHKCINPKCPFYEDEV